MKKLFKSIYHIIPFKKYLFLCIRRFLILPEKTFRHLSFHGKFKVRIDNGKSFNISHYGYQIENELFWMGLKGWEPVSIKSWLEYSKKSKVIVDIGANTGIFALLSKAVNPDSVVYAFEPVKRVYEKLQKNININKFEITALPLAISDKTGTEEIWDFDLDHPYGASLVKPEKETEIHKNYNINTISLDDFVFKNGINKIDLIKIDVETFEPQVLKGYSLHFSLHKPVLLIEILYDNIGEQVQKFVESSGVKYNYFFIDEKEGLVKCENIRRKNDLCYNYLLLPDIS